MRKHKLFKIENRIFALQLFDYALQTSLTWHSFSKYYQLREFLYFLKLRQIFTFPNFSYQDSFLFFFKL